MSNNSLLPVVIAGVNVLPFISMEHVLETVFSEGGQIKPGMAVAVNPEKILKAIEDNDTRSIINEAQFPYADGIGVVKALEKKVNHRLSRVAGCELWLEILTRSASFQSKVVLVGAKSAVVEGASQQLSARGVNVVGYINGYYESEQEVHDLLSETKPNIVIVALGSPKQEKLIKRLMSKHPNAFYMGVGGSFDVLTGAVERAPQSWQNLNVEWLYRLVKEPKRLFRQLKLLKFVKMYILKQL